VGEIFWDGRVGSPGAVVVFAVDGFDGSEPSESIPHGKF
jgi:hypothetical protein